MCFDIMDIHLIIIFFLFFNFVGISSGDSLLKVDMIPFLHLCTNKTPISRRFIIATDLDICPFQLRKCVKEKKIFLPFSNKYQIMKKMKEDIHDDIIRYFERIQEFQNEYECNMNDMKYIPQRTNLTTDSHDDLFKLITLIF